MLGDDVSMREKDLPYLAATHMVAQRPEDLAGRNGITLQAHQFCQFGAAHRPFLRGHEPQHGSLDVATRPSSPNHVDAICGGGAS